MAEETGGADMTAGLTGPAVSVFEGRGRDRGSMPKRPAKAGAKLPLFKDEKAPKVDSNAESIKLPATAESVIIYADGACVGNPGPGGYGVVLLDSKSLRRKELSGGYRYTTNNRMEIMAVMKGLEALKRPCRVQVFSDAKYVVNPISLGWIKRWEKKRWFAKPDKPRLNADLWERLLRLCEQHEVEIVWIKGHAGNKENEKCDELAESAARRPNLPPDEGFEKAKAGGT